jgi:hypothetical protein
MVVNKFSVYPKQFPPQSTFDAVVGGMLEYAEGERLITLMENYYPNKL